MKTASIMFLSCLLLLSFTGAAHAQAPIAGQPYQVPAGYEAYGAGTAITYAGYNYVIQGNGTMLLNANSQPADGGTTVAQGPAAGQPYQVPAGYEAYGPGTLITYAGYNYVIQGNGTMILNADSRPAGGGTTVAQGPAAGQPYQVPAGYEAYGPGTLIAYAGYNYVIQGNGTMISASSGQPAVPDQTFQQTQYTYQQPQYNYQQPQYTYQQPQYTYQQPQYDYQQPQYTYQQPQNYYQPGAYSGPTGGGMAAFGGAGVTGGGGQTRGGSNVAITVDPRTGQRNYYQINPGQRGQTSGGFGQMRGQWRGR